MATFYIRVRVLGLGIAFIGPFQDQYSANNALKQARDTYSIRPGKDHTSIQDPYRVSVYAVMPRTDSVKLGLKDSRVTPDLSAWNSWQSFESLSQDADIARDSDLENYLAEMEDQDRD